MKTASLLIAVLLLATVAHAAQMVAPPPGDYEAVPYDTSIPPMPIHMEPGGFVDPYSGHYLNKWTDMRGGVTFQELVTTTDGGQYRIVWVFEEIGPPPVYFSFTMRVDEWDPNPLPDGTWTTVRLVQGNLVGR